LAACHDGGPGPTEAKALSRKRRPDPPLTSGSKALLAAERLAFYRGGGFRHQRSSSHLDEIEPEELTINPITHAGDHHRPNPPPRPSRSSVGTLCSATKSTRGRPSSSRRRTPTTSDIARRPATDVGSQLTTDPQDRFQRAEGDLVANLGEHHRRHIQAPGFLCSAQVASTTGHQRLAAPRHRPQPPPASLERLPATEVREPTEGACPLDAPGRHRGQCPQQEHRHRGAHRRPDPPATLAAGHPPESPNVLPLCRGAVGDVGHERRVRGWPPASRQ
jgi:hypothetical protein